LLRWTGDQDRRGKRIAKEAFKPEQVMGRLREAEVLLSNVIAIGDASRKQGIIGQTCYAGLEHRQFSILFTGG
jgi:hypothetical protein